MMPSDVATETCMRDAFIDTNGRQELVKHRHQDGTAADAEHAGQKTRQTSPEARRARPRPRVSPVKNETSKL